MPSASSSVQRGAPALEHAARSVLGHLSGRFVDAKGRSARVGRPSSSTRTLPWYRCSMRSLVGFAASDVLGAPVPWLGGRRGMIRFALVLGLLGLSCQVGYDPVDGSAPPDSSSADGSSADASPAVDAAVAPCDPSDGCKRMRGGSCVTINPPVGCTATACGTTCFAFCPFALTWQGARTNCQSAAGWVLAENRQRLRKPVRGHDRAERRLDRPPPGVRGEPSVDGLVLVDRQRPHVHQLGRRLRRRRRRGRKRAMWNNGQHRKLARHQLHAGQRLDLQASMTSSMLPAPKPRVRRTR